MRHLVYSTLSFLALLLACATLQAQNEQVDIVKDFNARLIDAQRFNLSPQLPPLDTSLRRQTYTLSARPLEVQYLPPKIRPIQLPREEGNPIYKGYARVGAGLPNAFTVDAGYDLVGSETVNLGFDLSHLSANNKKLENQRFANNHLGVHGDYFSDLGFAIKGNLGYRLDNLYFYGYNDLDDDTVTPQTYAPEDVRQRFKELSGHAEIFNHKSTVANVDYRANLDFGFLADNYAARESNIRLNLGGTYWMNDKHPIAVDLITDFTSFRDTSKQSLNNIMLQPNYTFHGDRFRAKIGVNIVSFNDEFTVYPQVELAANIVENVLTAFVGAEGGLRKNNFKSLTDYNPFLTSRLRIRNAFYNNFYGGIKGEFLGFNYQAQVSYQDIDNLALFLTNTDSIPRFNVVYDTAKIFSIGGELSTELLPNLNIRGSVYQRIYSLKQQDKPWHLPSLTLNAGATYLMLDNKLRLRADVFAENGVPFLGGDLQIGNLNPLLDVSGGAEYRFTDQISGFVQVNNILNNKRQRWHHYPVMGINAFAGISARF
ncbi:MAG: hypothetical protein H6555_01850 [Lewinellaceae bacterium]|nr:hypothetical protein [Lewinellaceae bacterium]